MQLGPITDEDLPRAAELLEQTNFGPPRAELLSDFTSSRSRWPTLQIGIHDEANRLRGLVAGRLDRSDASIGWSDDLVVDTALQGRGLGGELIKAQLEAFRRLGCKKVRGLSPRRHFAQIAFFERHGFRVIERTVSQGLWGIADGEELCVTEKTL